MPKAFPEGFRRDVVAVARRRQVPMSRVAKDFGISESCLAAGQPRRGEAHDIWIVVCAIVHGIPVLTNNLRHFTPVAEALPDLGLVHPSL